MGWLFGKSEKSECKQFKSAKEAHEETKSKYLNTSMYNRMTGNSFRSACEAAKGCDSQEAKEFFTNKCSSINGGRKKKRKSRRRKKTKKRSKTKRKSRRRKSRKSRRRRRRKSRR